MTGDQTDLDELRVLFVNSNLIYRAGDCYYSTFSWVKFPEFVAASIGQATVMAPMIRVANEGDVPATCFEVVSPPLLLEGSDHFSSLAEYLKLLPRRYFTWRRQIRRLVDEHDAVVHRIPSPNLSLVARETKRAGKPLFVMVAGDVSQQAEPLFGANRFRRLVYKLAAKWILRRQVRVARGAARVYAFSGELRSHFKMGNPDTVLFRTPIVSRTQIQRRGERKMSTPIRLVRVCWLMRSKGLETLFRAVALLGQRGHDVVLSVVGAERQAGYQAELEALTKELDIAGVVSFSGWVQYDQISDVYMDGDIHVMSSLAEGMPRSILESAASGLPQVCTEVGGCADYLTDGHDAILVPPGDGEALCDGIERILNDDELRCRLVENGYKLAEESCYENAGTRLLTDIADSLNGTLV